MFSLLFFCLDAKEKITKEKIKAALFGLLRSGVTLKKKNSLRSNSFFFFTLHPTPYASRLKNEANRRRNIASLVGVDVLLVLVIQNDHREEESRLHQQSYAIGQILHYTPFHSE